MKKDLFDKIYASYLKSPQWKKKRKLVMARDKGICQGCLESKAMDIHHKTYARVFDEPLFDLVAICRDCHDKIHDGRTNIQRAQRFVTGNLKPLEVEDKLRSIMNKMRENEKC